MSTFPNSPKLARGGLVVIDPATAQTQRVILLQYNPDTLSRTLQVQGASAEPGDRLETLRLKGPPIETIKLEAELDATDALEHPDQHLNTARHGLLPQLAAIELLIYPTSSQLLLQHIDTLRGLVEIFPVETPLTIFVWGKSRIVPVRITEFSVTEEAFDASLNPTRAKVSLGLRVLSVNDLGFDHRGGQLYLAYQRQKETLGNLGLSVDFQPLGIKRITGG